MSTLVPIVVGFLLTTVLGGLLTTWLQQRAWDHQRVVSLAEKELEAANRACVGISELLDKRLYRMLRLYSAMRTTATSGDRLEVVKERLQAYDEVLYEWNDRLNLNLALMGTYFGEAARDWLHFEIYERFQSVGAELEAVFRHVVHGQPLAVDMTEVEAHLSMLNEQVYRLGAFMMTQLRGGRVGRTAPRPVQAQLSPADVTDPPVTLQTIAPSGSTRKSAGG